MENNSYRHEFKYLVDEKQLVVLESRIKGIMSLDEHANEGTYNIRSMYFDDYDNSCFYANEDGLNEREKYRIRIYNSSNEKISLECKRKVNGMTQKLSCPLSTEQYYELVNGKPSKLCFEANELIASLAEKIISVRMKPAIIVDYNRKPFVYKSGNVRITFDRYISSSTCFDRFFDKDMSKRPVMPNEYQLLEVKYDDYLPSYLYECLQIDNLNQTTYSKYYYCRKISL